MEGVEEARAVEVTEALVQAQWRLFKEEYLQALMADDPDGHLTSEEAVELALALQDQMREEEEEARTLALYEQTLQFDMDELAYQLQQWDIG